MNNVEKNSASPSSGSKTGRNIALATALAALLATNVDAQTVGKNFDAKHLDKYEKTYEKSLKKDDLTKETGKTYDMSPGAVVNMLHDEIDYMVKLIPTLVVDHTTFKAYLMKGLQENNILDFLLYGDGSATYKTLADGLSTQLVDYETKDINIISNKIKFPINIPSSYVE
ncbi:hypothetical protein KA037_04830 [Patescibacteria group bacterium]|nr:hypothetical protein [Patescibacteria group bacterium]